MIYLRDIKTSLKKTVEYDERFKDRPLVVCLKEDPSEVKWLFSVLDLEVVK